MEAVTLTKGSEIEVSSNDIGFEGAWYVATLVDVIEPSSTNKKTSNKKNRYKKKTTRYLVKYDMLLDKDGSSEKLTEIVDPSFVRPLPPRNPLRNNDNEAEAEVEEGGDFEVYDVVDAFHRDGWWIGVVKEVIIDGETKKFVVRFENPPEEVEFERSQLRLHVDWIDGSWKVAPKKTPEQKSAVRNATQSSGSKNVALSGFGTPSKGVLTTDSGNLTVGSRLSSRKKSQKKTATNGSPVGIVDLVEKNSLGKRLKSSTGGNGNTEAIISTIETSGPRAINQDSPHFAQEMIIAETRETEDDNSQHIRKRGRPQKLRIIRPNGLLTDNQEAENVIQEITAELDQQPLSVWFQGIHRPSGLKRASCCTAVELRDIPSDTLTRAIVPNGETTVYQQNLPFIKQSPIWATLESLELYRNPPQNPHFSPLKETKEDFREGLAIAHMVTFANVVQRTSELQWTDPNNIFENSLETLVDLEAHGFDVGVVRARLTKLLGMKSKVDQLEDELKEADKEFEKCNCAKTAMKKEIDEIEVKMKELEEKLAQYKTMENTKDEEVRMLQTKLHTVSKRVEDQKLAFDILVASHL